MRMYLLQCPHKPHENHSSSSCMLSFSIHGLNYSVEGVHVVYLSLLDSTFSVRFYMIAVAEK